MADLFPNPLGLDGFEFVEFSAPEKGLLEPVFARMGFTQIARHRSKDVHLWRQGGINLIANYEPRSPAAYFAAEHGPSACGMGWRVRDAARAYGVAIERGAEPVAEIPVAEQDAEVPVEVEAAAPQVAEAAPVKKPRARKAAAKADAAPETATQAEPEEAALEPAGQDAPEEPRRGGWWQRTFG